MLILSCTPEDPKPFLWVETKRDDCLPLLSYAFLRSPLNAKTIYKLFEQNPKLIFNLTGVSSDRDLKVDSTKHFAIDCKNFKQLLVKMQPLRDEYYFLSSLFFGSYGQVTAHLYPIDGVGIGEKANAALRRLVIEDVLTDLK